MTTMSRNETRPTLRASLEDQLDLVVPQAGSRKNRRKAFLMISTGPAAGTVFPVIQRSLLIGRSLAADVRVDEQAISNEHARLEQTDAGFTLLDLGSTNGTYVNGRRLVHAAQLSGGDTIEMGSTTFTFVTRESGIPKGTVRLQKPDLHDPDVMSSMDGAGARHARSEAMAPPPSQQTGSLSLTDAVRTVKTYWVYARRYGHLLGLGAAFGLFLGLLQVWIHPPPGSAWFEMSLVSTDRASGGGDDAAPPLFIGAESIFRSLPLIKKTLADLGLPNASDAFASDIQAELTFEPVAYNSKVYRGTYQDSSPQAAVRFLDQHVHVYIESELDKLLKVLKNDAAFDREQEQRAVERVAEARSELVAFSDEHPEAVPKDAKLPPEMARARLAPTASPERIQQAMASTRRALRNAYSQIQAKKAQPYLERATKAENDIAEARARGLRDEHPDIKKLRNLEASLRARANALLAAEPSESEQALDPQIASLKEELADLENRLRQLPASATASGNGALVPAALSTTTSALEPAARPPRAPAESLAQLKIQYGELSREYERAKTEHEALMKKRETTDRQLERERTSAEARYGIITPPTAAQSSVFRALVKRGLMGVFVGFTLALLAAAYLELRRILIVRGHIS
ncbi:MAG TPA: FHA domain-containing protein [Polyangiaceae bacterium]|nr:FHA domain-containing protein [Polyangiaceae bacterium]